MTTWLPGARVVDLTGSRGNGPFKAFLGVILHVNVDETGTPDSFWGAGPDVNPSSVCPNFQVFKDGSVTQPLPFNWQPWCQADGNTNYAAIETAGLPGEPLTGAQRVAIARILAIYHTEMGLPLQLANAPGQRGLGTHQMGGAAWGGHSCPGDIRANQRQSLLTLAAANVATGSGTELDMPLNDADVAKIWAYPLASQYPKYKASFPAGRWLSSLAAQFAHPELTAVPPPATAAQLAKLQGQVAGLLSAIGHLSAGEPIDLDAVIQAAQDGAAAGVSAVLDNLKLSIDAPDPAE